MVNRPPTMTFNPGTRCRAHCWSICMLASFLFQAYRPLWSQLNLYLASLFAVQTALVSLSAVSQERFIFKKMVLIFAAVNVILRVYQIDRRNAVELCRYSRITLS